MKDPEKLTVNRLSERKIRSDLEKVGAWINTLNLDQSLNYQVVEANYLTPLCSGRIRPMNHELGLYTYFLGLHEGLQLVLSERVLTTDLLRKSPPKYIKDFVKTSSR